AAVRWSSYEADRLSQLAEDLLLIARTDGGRLPLRVEPVPVNDLFAAVLSRFDWRAAELGKTVTAAPAGALLVEADPIRLQQALGNFVDNALRYGGNEVTLEAARSEEAARGPARRRPPLRSRPGAHRRSPSGHGRRGRRRPGRAPRRAPRSRRSGLRRGTRRRLRADASDPDPPQESRRGRAAVRGLQADGSRPGS